VGNLHIDEYNIKIDPKYNNRRGLDSYGSGKCPVATN
jgi:hypothetical protein